MQKFLLFPDFLFSAFQTRFYQMRCILPISQLQTQQVTTSQIRSHMDLLYYCAHFVVEGDEKSSHNGGL